MNEIYSNTVKFLYYSYFKLLIVTMENTGVKIDGTLLKRVEKLIKRQDKKIQYAHKKQFINVAVLKLLEKEEKIILQ